MHATFNLSLVMSFVANHVFVIPLFRLRTLTICTKKPVFSDEMSNGTVQPGENFPE